VSGTGLIGFGSLKAKHGEGLIMKSIYQLLGLASARDVKDLAASVASAHERIVELEKAAESARALVQRLDSTSNVFHDALARVEDDVTSLQHDIDDVCGQVESNIDIDDIADRVKDTIDKQLGSDKIDHAVNQAIEREAPGIIGSVLKHIDWSEELTVDATVHSNR
jgi:chromosome segregation ATPase